MTADYIHLRDMRLFIRVGVRPHELKAPQPLLLNLKLKVTPPKSRTDDLDQVVCYETLAEKIRQLSNQPHLNLLETLADHIMAICFSFAPVETVELTLEKERIFPDIAAVGIQRVATRKG